MQGRDERIVAGNVDVDQTALAQHVKDFLDKWARLDDVLEYLGEMDDVEGMGRLHLKEVQVMHVLEPGGASVVHESAVNVYAVVFGPAFFEFEPQPGRATTDFQYAEVFAPYVRCVPGVAVAGENRCPGAERIRADCRA
jgi:hypothetical protein